MQKLKLRIEGMDCEGCTTAIENMLKMRTLASEAKVDYKRKKAVIEFDEKKVGKQKIIKAIADVGYKVAEVK